MHLIFRRLQWPWLNLSAKALQEKIAESCQHSKWKTYRMQQMSDGNPACFFFSLLPVLGDPGPARSIVAALGEAAAPAAGAAAHQRPASIWSASASAIWRTSQIDLSAGCPNPGPISCPFRRTIVAPPSNWADIQMVACLCRCRFVTAVGGTDMTLCLSWVLAVRMDI